MVVVEEREREHKHRREERERGMRIEHEKEEYWDLKWQFLILYLNFLLWSILIYIYMELSRFRIQIIWFLAHLNLVSRCYMEFWFPNRLLGNCNKGRCSKREGIQNVWFHSFCSQRPTSWEVEDSSLTA